MKWLARLLSVYFTTRMVKQKVSEIKLQSLKRYVRVVQMARMSTIGLIGLMIAAAILALGFTILVTTLIFLLPLTLEQRLWSLLTYGALVSLIGMVSVASLLSEQRWLRQSGLTELLDEALASKVKIRSEIKTRSSPTTTLASASRRPPQPREPAAGIPVPQGPSLPVSAFPIGPIQA